MKTTALFFSLDPEVISVDNSGPRHPAIEFQEIASQNLKKQQQKMLKQTEKKIKDWCSRRLCRRANSRI